MAIHGLIWIALAAGIAYALWPAWSHPHLASLGSQLRPLPLVGALLLMLGVTVASVPCWLVIFRQLGGRLGAKDALRVSLLTNLGKYLPGKVMHAAGRVALLQARGQPVSISLASVTVDVGLSILAAALVGLLSAPLFLRTHGLVNDTRPLVWAWVLTVLFGLVAFHPRTVRRGLALSASVMPGARMLQAVPIPSYATIVPMLAARVVLWLTMSLALFLTARSVHPLGWDWLPALGGVAALSYLFGLAVPIAPAGIGAREGSMTLLLVMAMPAPEAAATSVLFRLISILAEVAAAGAMLPFSLARQDQPALVPGEELSVD